MCPLCLQDPDARVDATRFPEVKTVDGYQGREKEAGVCACEP